MTRFNPRVVHVKSVMEEVELEQLFLQPVQLSPAKQYSTNGLYHLPLGGWYNKTMWGHSMNELSVTPFLHLKQHM